MAPAFWFGLSADVVVLVGFPVLHLGGFSHADSWFELFEPVNSRLYFMMWNKSEMKLQCPSTSTFATTSLSKLTLRRVSENLVQREPLERNGNYICRGLEIVTKETLALHFCFQGWVEWHVQNCSIFCHVTNILGFVMTQYRQLSQQGTDYNTRLGENFQLLPGQKWAYCLRTFLEASDKFLGFFVPSVLDSSCFLWWNVGLLLLLLILNRLPKEWVRHSHACLYTILQYSSKVCGEMDGWGNSKQHTRESSWVIRLPSAWRQAGISHSKL